jgi:hypothetical protein
MKEQILTLESTDDLHSLRDKIARAQAGRLVLMWPALEEPVSRRLELELMKIWAAAGGSELAIVSADPSVRNLARSAGIPAYPNLTASALAGLSTRPPARRDFSAFRSGRRPPAVPPPKINRPPLSPALRIAVFSAAVLSIASVFLLLLPSARLRVVFPSRTLEASGAVDPALCSMISIQLSLADRRTTSGRVLAPTAYAEGKVRLTNFASRVLNLPAGIRVASGDDVQFDTIGGAIIAPGQSLLVPVRAVDPGPRANLGAGKINRVLGPLALSLKAENPEPTSGGSEAWRNTVSQADLDGLRTALTAQARREAFAGLQNLAGPGRLLVEDSLNLEFDPRDAPDIPVGTPADSIGLALHASAAMKTCPGDAIRMRAVQMLAPLLHAGETLLPESVILQLTGGGENGILLAVAGMAAAIPDRNDMALAVRAQTPGQAVSILRDTFKAVDVPLVELRPGWIPLLPLFPFQIEIAAEAG